MIAIGIEYDEIANLVAGIQQECRDIFEEYCGSNGLFPHIINTDSNYIVNCIVQELSTWGVMEGKSSSLVISIKSIKDLDTLIFILNRLEWLILHTVIIRKELLHIFIEEGISILKQWLKNKRKIISVIKNFKDSILQEYDSSS